MLNILIDIRNLLVYNKSNVLYTIVRVDFNMLMQLNILAEKYEYDIIKFNVYLGDGKLVFHEIYRNA